MIGAEPVCPVTLQIISRRRRLDMKNTARKTTVFVTALLCLNVIVPDSAVADSEAVRNNPVAALNIHGDRTAWATLDAFPVDSAGESGIGPFDVDWHRVTMAHRADVQSLFIRYELTTAADFSAYPAFYNIFVDVDNNRATGYIGGGGQFPVGAEYLIQGASVFSFAGGGDQTAFVWDYKGAADFDIQSSGVDIAMEVPLSLMGTPTSFRFVLYGDNVLNGNTPDYYPDTGDGGEPGGFFEYSTATQPEEPLGEMASYSPAPTANDYNNPHKGFMLWGTDYADGAPNNYYGATIYHIYVPWREIETSDQVFEWGRFETNHLLPILNKDPRATFVLRPVADYPDGQNSGVTLFYTGGDLRRDFPSFLTNAPLSITAYPYTSCDGDGPGITPDWNDPAMITQLVQFVQAFAERYDGDPRITAVQVGLLGLWGEWHQSGCDNRGPSSAVKIAVRDAYAAAFTNTPLQTRYPGNPDAVGVEFGFHEDYFPSFTAPCIYGFPDCDDSGPWNMSYGFTHVTPGSADNWLSNPISGESPNTNQKRTWSNDVADVMTVLRDYHFSFLGPAGGHENQGNGANLLPMKRLLGYNYQIVRVDWPTDIWWGHDFDVTLVLTNTGAAPIYHRFPVEVALCDAAGVPVWRGTYSFDLRTLTPNVDFERTEHFATPPVAPGVYSLRIGIVDPRTGEPGIRIQSAGEDANYRIVIGNVQVRDPTTSDIDGDGIPDGWEFEHFGSFTGAVATADTDGDGQSNLEHYISGTNPTNATSYFRVESVSPDGALVVQVKTVTNRVYTVERSDDLSAGLWSGIGEPFDGTGELISVPDANPTPVGLYRAGVSLKP